MLLRKYRTCEAVYRLRRLTPSKTLTHPAVTEADRSIISFFSSSEPKSRPEISREIPTYWLSGGRADTGANLPGASGS